MLGEEGEVVWYSVLYLVSIGAGSGGVVGVGVGCVGRSRVEKVSSAV